MMPGTWRRFYEGTWKEPGLGGKASYVNAYSVIYNSQIGKYIGFNHGSSVTVCSDLSKQDWTPCFKVPGDSWGCNGVWAWHVTESGKQDIFTAGNTMFLYSYWKDDGHRRPPNATVSTSRPAARPITPAMRPRVPSVPRSRPQAP